MNFTYFPLVTFLSQKESGGMLRAIAIDGPAASGKSSAARKLSEELGLVMVNSGAMYRAVAWKMLESGINPQDTESVITALPHLQIECGVDESGHFSTVGFGGKVLDSELKTEAVNNAVSAIAKIPEVRSILVNKQRDYLEHSDVVMEGRDIGTVVFPDTPYKFFFQASEKIRQARREAEGITDSIADRDKEDSSRKTAPLKAADDAILVNTEDYDLEGVVKHVISHLERLGW